MIQGTTARAPGPASVRTTALPNPPSAATATFGPVRSFRVHPPVPGRYPNSGTSWQPRGNRTWVAGWAYSGKV